MDIKKILIAGTINNFCLETSYSNAASHLGYEVIRFDPVKESGKFIKFGKLGKKLHDFLPVEPWIRKMNRELIVLVKETKPDVLLLFGTSKILYGTLITIKLINPQCKLVWIWPDTPMNLTSSNLDNACLFDISATYSKASLELFSKMGFANTRWIALAGDKMMHWNAVREEDDFDCDVSFVGMWRPEREKVMKIINDNFSDLKIELYGNYWKRNCVDKKLMEKWKGDGFYAKELSAHFNRSRININIIDDTNFPAANMRFFEIPASGGLQLSSPCPEFADEFIDNRHILYFNDEVTVIEKIKWILANKEQVQAIRYEGQELVNQKHNYTQRLKVILENLNQQQ